MVFFQNIFLFGTVADTHAKPRHKVETTKTIRPQHECFSGLLLALMTDDNPTYCVTTRTRKSTGISCICTRARYGAWETKNSNEKADHTKVGRHYRGPVCNMCENETTHTPGCSPSLEKHRLPMYVHTFENAVGRFFYKQITFAPGAFSRDMTVFSANTTGRIAAVNIAK